MLFSILIAFILCEIGARVWLSKYASEEDQRKFCLYEDMDPSKWRIQPHHYLNYALTPNHQKGDLSINSRGFRGGEITLPKPKGVFRVVAIGGSTTYTEQVLDNKMAYPFLLEDRLKNTYSIDSLEVINAGVPGYDTWESFINLQFRALDLEPDLVVIYQGTNDVHSRLVRPKHYLGDNSGRRKQWELPQIPIWDRSAILRIIRRKRGLSHQIWLQSLVVKSNDIRSKERSKILEQNPPIYFYRNLKSMIAICQAHDLKVMMATWAHSPQFNDYAASEAYQKGFKEHNEVIKGLGKEMNVPVFDFASVMDQDKKYWVDGRHVNEEGATLKADLFAEFIQKQFFLK